ncbi:MAG: hypothetical protein D6723_04685 [Acidobacteria bacterium]|nr:MAG: hypothetical protein D6723_04685 [Acidobacteriota bacterium]
MALITIQDFDFTRAASQPALHLGQWYCRQLERGHILFFPHIPFELSEEDRAFLLTQQQAGTGYHKNIAYRPHQDRITGLVKRSREEEERLRALMRTYSRHVTRFMAVLLPPYASRWRLDYASFRPQEERGRPLRLRSRNDLLHVDAFPTRPTGGGRILRVFTNIHPTRPRLWVTSETCDVLIERLAGTPGLPLPSPWRRSVWSCLRHGLAAAGRRAGLPLVRRSPYDAFMLRLHHYLKEHEEYQTSCPKQVWAFPPRSTWIVFTDMVTHAVLSGQFALEQTFIVPHEVLVLPEKSPLRVLERLVGASLTAME